MRDVVGKTFGRLTVVERAVERAAPGARRRARWVCRCVCGQTTVVLQQNLAKGTTQSCGCLRRDLKSGPPINPGDRFGRYTVAGAAEKDRHGNPRWLCRCECGNERIVLQFALRQGKTVSCGCYQREASAAANRTHGQTDSPEHNSWTSMLGRCFNSNDERWEDYGGRGISVCERWRGSFENFLADMGPRPSPEHSLDRYPDPDGNYEPDNCRWATRSEQQRNRRCTPVLEYKGERRPLIEWAERLGIPYQTLSTRIRRGWSVERAMTAPVQERRT